jgi:hypothetical protein
MSRSIRLMRRVAVVSALLVVAGTVAPGAALAGILAEATASASVATARWSAVPAAAGASSLTTSFSTGYGTGQTRYALVDVYNSGTVPISGFTILGTRTGSGNGTLQACASGWTEPSRNNQAPRCDGAAAGASVATLQPGSPLSIAASIPPGGRLSLRIQSSNATWSLSVAVTN